MMFTNLTTNERINSFRYNYLKNDQGRFYNPFNFGCRNNFCMFFGCKKYPEVEVTPFDAANHAIDVSSSASESILSNLDVSEIDPSNGQQRTVMRFPSSDDGEHGHSHAGGGGHGHSH